MDEVDAAVASAEMAEVLLPATTAASNGPVEWGDAILDAVEMFATPLGLDAFQGVEVLAAAAVGAVGGAALDVGVVKGAAAGFFGGLVFQYMRGPDAGGL